MDHKGLYTVHVIFIGCYLMAGLATASYSWRMHMTGQVPAMNEHPYIQLLMMSYAASTISSLLFLVHYHYFIQDGFGSPNMRFMGICIGAIATCILYLLALLASCGWAITKCELSYRRRFLGTVSAVGFMHVLSEVCSEVLVDQSTQLYGYSGLSGTVILMLKVFIFCWVACQAKVSYEDDQVEKRRMFFKVLGISMSGCLLIMPITALCAFYLVPWLRYKVVTTVDLAARLLASLVFSCLFCGPVSPISAENTFVLQEITSEYSGFSSFNS